MRVRYQMRLGEEQTMRMGNPLAGRGSHAGSLSRSLPGHPKSVQNLFWSARYYGRDSDTTPEVTVLVSRAQQSEGRMQKPMEYNTVTLWEVISIGTCIPNA